MTTATATTPRMRPTQLPAGTNAGARALIALGLEVGAQSDAAPCLTGYYACPHCGRRFRHDFKRRGKRKNGVLLLCGACDWKGLLVPARLVTAQDRLITEDAWVAMRLS